MIGRLSVHQCCCPSIISLLLFPALLFPSLHSNEECLVATSVIIPTTINRTSVSQAVQFSRSVMFDSLWPHERQHERPPCPSPTPGVHSNSCPPSRWCHPAISSSVIPFSSAPNPSQHQSLFQWVNSSLEMAKVLEFQLQHQSFQWTPRTDFH